MPLPKSKKPRIPEGFERAFRDFQTIPNVGRATAEDLVRLRVRSVGALAKKNPMTLYRAICKLDGARHDPCVIDVFMAAVDFAKRGECKPWWHYTPERKALLDQGRKPARRAAALVGSRWGGEQTSGVSQ